MFEIKQHTVLPLVALRYFRSECTTAGVIRVFPLLLLLLVIPLTSTEDWVKKEFFLIRGEGFSQILLFIVNTYDKEKSLQH